MMPWCTGLIQFVSWSQRPQRRRRTVANLKGPCHPEKTWQHKFHLVSSKNKIYRNTCHFSHNIYIYICIVILYIYTVHTHWVVYFEYVLYWSESTQYLGAWIFGYLMPHGDIVGATWPWAVERRCLSKSRYPGTHETIQQDKPKMVQGGGPVCDS